MFSHHWKKDENETHKKLAGENDIRKTEAFKVTPKFLEKYLHHLIGRFFKNNLLYVLPFLYRKMLENFFSYQKTRGIGGRRCERGVADANCQICRSGGNSSTFPVFPFDFHVFIFLRNCRSLQSVSASPSCADFPGRSLQLSTVAHFL
jgi:hypothetical protein